MSWPYIHLVLNHFPSILLILGTVALILGLITRRRSVLLYAVASITLAGITVYPVVFSGEEAEHTVERIPTVSEDRIHEHEGAADQALWMVLITGAIAAYTWWRLVSTRGAAHQINVDGKPVALLPTWLSIIMVITSLMALASVLMTSYKGGKILHQELVTPPVQSSASSTAPLM